MRSRTSILPLLAALLASCGGGGGDAGPAAVPATPPVPPTAAPVTPPAAPTAAFVATPLAGSAPLAVQFDASSSTGNPIAAYRWDFGDGSATASGVSASHVYPRLGTHSVTLTVIDGDGRTASISQQVTIATASMPNLIGLTEAQAVDALAALGLEAGIRVVSGRVSGGGVPVVTSASRLAGATLPPGTRIDLALSNEATAIVPALRISPRSGRGSETPDSGELVGDRLQLGVLVTSTFELASGVARLADRQAALTFYRTVGGAPCEFDTCYAGTLDLAGVPWGPQELSVRATDVRGNFSELRVAVIHDARPRLTVVAPLDNSVALPTLPIDVSCIDDQPGCRIEVLGPAGAGPREHLVDADGSAVANVDLTRWAGGTFDLLFRVFDSAGQLTEVRRNIYVESSPRLRILATQPGRIVDTDGDRLLMLENGDDGDRISIFARTSATTVPIPLPTGQRVDDRFARLTPSGAVFGAQPVTGSVLNNGLYLWRAGTLTQVGPGGIGTTLGVAGDFAVWDDGRTIQRLRPSTGVSTPVATQTRVLSTSVAADGAVVFSGDGGVLVRDRAGAQTALTSDASRLHLDPVTDGDLVVYTQRTVSSPFQSATALVIGSAAPVLLTPLTALTSSSGRQYQVAGGWAAFSDFGAQQQQHVFLRSPLGVVSRLTDFSGNSTLDRLAGNGEAMVQNGAQRYFSRGTSLVPVSSANGRSYWIGGAWYLAIGASLLAVDTTGS